MHPFLSINPMVVNGQMKNVKFRKNVNSRWGRTEDSECKNHLDFVENKEGENILLNK